MYNIFTCKNKQINVKTPNSFLFTQLAAFYGFKIHDISYSSGIKYRGTVHT